jgi:hypothetical protein
MTVNIHQLIAAISPDVYCEPAVRKQVKKLVGEGMETGDALAFLKAAELARPCEPNRGDDLPAESFANPFSQAALKAPVAQRTFARDALAESLEAFYFKLLDLFSDPARWHVTKLVDNFEPSPGAAGYGDFSRRLTEARQEAERMVKASREMVRSLLRDYDKLKQDQGQLREMEEMQSDDPAKRNAAAVVLKQHWLETVEKRRGSMSLLRLNSQFPGRDLLDRFMGEDPGASPITSGTQDWVDLTLKRRSEEFERWVRDAREDLKRRNDVLKSQLRQDAELLKLYARWLQPMLRHGSSQRGTVAGGGAIVSGFNSAVLEMVLLVRGESVLEEKIEQGELPRFLGRPALRHYFPVLIVEVSMRGTATGAKLGEHPLRGRVEVRCTSYGLNEPELEILTREVNRLELQETLRAVETTSDEVNRELAALVGEVLDLEGGDVRVEGDKDTNPFSGLFSAIRSFFEWWKGKPKATAGGGMAVPGPDSYLEKVVRSLMIAEAQTHCGEVVAQLKEWYRGPVVGFRG